MDEGAAERRDIFTQTDHEVHDVFYYKTRAYKAENALLALRRDQYLHHLQVKLKEMEKETSGKLQLYSYDPDKCRHLQMDFQSQILLTKQFQQKAQDIFNFNLHALNDGHELSDLPFVEDKDVDLNTFRLGPVTPTIPSGSRPSLHMPSLSQGADNTDYSAMFGAPGSDQNIMLTNGGGTIMNGLPPHSSAYVFPKSTEASQSSFNLDHSVGQVISFGTDQSAAPPTSQFNDLDLQNTARGEEILRMISIDSLSTRQHSAPSNNFHTNFSITSRRAGCASSALTSTTRPPDVVPRPASARSNASPNSSHGSMGLDNLDLDYTSVQKKSSQQKWSQIAAIGSDLPTEGDWQAVGSKKGRPLSSTTQIRSQPMSVTHTNTAGLVLSGSAAASYGGTEAGANFEVMVSAVQEKYQLTRPEVIAVLQVVRNERNGDMNISLGELMKDAERLLSRNKNVLKPASLTARARAVPDHAEPCENQLCPARLKLLKYRTELCLSYQTTGKCHMKPGSCVYAHGETEQRPLPKEELCERYLEGKCNNRRCVYAHGASELKNRPMVNTVEYLKSKNKKPAPEMKKVGVEDLTLTEADLDPRGDECAICLERMSKKSRRKLDCGHDAFHFKCLKKWVGGEGDRSCPLCRSNTLLPEEYPRLGSH